MYVSQSGSLMPRGKCEKELGVPRPRGVAGDLDRDSSPLPPLVNALGRVACLVGSVLAFRGIPWKRSDRFAPLRPLTLFTSAA